jgi:class 3 adenylate cyclase/tetratricopeptide (TPR) repeat protein
MSDMHCASCGTELLPGKQFCHACGARATLTCPSCGAEVEAGFRFCPDCGFEIAAERAQPPGGDSPRQRFGTSMPAGMADKIRASRRAIEGERKQVTVMFCDLVGSTAVAGHLDPEEYREVIDRYTALAMHEIYRFEGFVNQLAGDGVMALFGAPIAHEDAPQRAVWTALAIRDALAQFNDELKAERGFELPARIGIHTGPVVVGTVGSDLKMDYTAIGDTTNLAARLESLARPGTVLISEATARLVRGFFEMRPVEPLDVKGKDEPISACEVIGVSREASPMAVAAARGLTPLVGRAEELAQLDACFHRLQGRLAQIVSVVGDAGSGKSRVIHEFKRALAAEDVVFLEGRCSALNQMEPYFPIVTMLRAYFELSGEEPDEVECERVARKVGIAQERLQEEYPLLCGLLSVSPGHGAEGAPEELKRQTFDGLARLVISESRRQPVVMIVEDLHWIDEASRELLEMAASRLVRAPVMLLVSHRPEYRPAWRTTAATTQLFLRPLSNGEIVAITEALAGGKLPEDLRRSILEKAEGSPFFAEEITRSLLEEGYLTAAEDGECHLTRPVEEIRIPGTVQEVLAARLDRLGVEAKRVVQVAAVFGRQFSGARLEQLLADEGLDVAAQLRELEQRGIIHRKSMFSTEEYRFGESLTQEVAYEGLLIRQRRQLHERIGLLLERGTGDGAERPVLIAHHFAHSDNREKAVETLLRAAAEAERLPSYGSAIDLYRRAWDLAEAASREDAGGDERLRTWLIEATLGFTRVTVLYGTSDDPEARRAIERGSAVAREMGAEGAMASFCTYYGMILAGDRLRFSDALPLIEQGVAIARRVGPEVTALNISRAMAWTYLLDGRFDEARRHIEKTVGELERLGQRDQLSDLYLGARWMRDKILFCSDELAAGLESAPETHELAVRAGNRTIQTLSASGLGHVSYLRGQPQEAKRWADRALEIAEAIGSIGAIHHAAAIALAARVDLGDPHPMARYADVIEEGIHTGGNLLLSIGVAVESFLAIGDHKRAERMARKAYDLAAGRLREMLCAVALGDVSQHLGPAHYAEAASWYERALSLARALGSRSGLALASLGAADLALGQGNTVGSAPYRDSARELFRDLGMRRYLRRAGETPPITPPAFYGALPAGERSGTL